MADVAAFGLLKVSLALVTVIISAPTRVAKENLADVSVAVALPP